MPSFAYNHAGRQYFYWQSYIHSKSVIVNFILIELWIFIGSADFLGLNLFTAIQVTPTIREGELKGLHKDAMVDYSADTNWERYINKSTNILNNHLFSYEI